jgi:hypothetical protein
LEQFGGHPNKPPAGEPKLLKILLLLDQCLKRILAQFLPKEAKIADKITLWAAQNESEIGHNQAHW